MVSAGQIWEYRRDPGDSWLVPDKLLYKASVVFRVRMAWQIVSGEFRGSDLYWIAKVVRDEDGFLGDATHPFKEEVFENGERFRLIYDPAQDSDVYCTQCGKLYPYAVWRPNFACWECRSGF